MLLRNWEISVLKSCVPFQKCNLMFILLIVLTERLCHEESKWKCKEMMSGGGTHGPACCRGLGASASPVIAVVASQPGAAAFGQSVTPLLSPGSSCHIF